MTLKEFKDKVDVTYSNSHGCYEVTINYRGKEYKCTTNDSMAFDVIRSWIRDDIPAWGYTPKQAYQVLWNECKRKNNLK